MHGVKAPPRWRLRPARTCSPTAASGAPRQLHLSRAWFEGPTLQVALEAGALVLADGGLWCAPSATPVSRMARKTCLWRSMRAGLHGVSSSLAVHRPPFMVLLEPQPLQGMHASCLQLFLVVGCHPAHVHPSSPLPHPPRPLLCARLPAAASTSLTPCRRPSAPPYMRRWSSRPSASPRPAWCGGVLSSPHL